MIIFKQAADLKKYLQKEKISELTVGFVPTMGALHRGHLSLLKECKKATKITVASIFVNPTQFNNMEDFKKYPHTLESDISLLEQAGCDILFLPDEKELYPDENSKHHHFDLDYVETILEGKFRPGHFQGVCLVVEKLLNIVEPDFLFMGQKDFQQCMVIKKLIKIMNSNVRLIICPIVREENGLAMSSRNLRLNVEERNLASSLYQTLLFIKENRNKKSFIELKKIATTELEGKGFKVEYIELAKSDSLLHLSYFDKHEDQVLLVAAWLKGVRLIDNLLINP